MTPPLQIPVRLCTLALSAALLSGCLLSAPHLDPMRLDMEARIPGVKLEPGIQMHFGRMSLGLARGIARLAMDNEEEEDEVMSLLRHVKGVEVAIYETDLLVADGAQRWSTYLSEMGARRGWIPTAQVSTDDAASAVFFKFKGDQIRRVFLFTLNDEKMVMVRFKGKLDRIIADGLALYGNEIAEELAQEELDGVSTEHQEEGREEGESEEITGDEVSATSTR